MMAKEKHLAVVRRLEEPPLCECGDRAMINPQNMLEFVYPNKHEVSGKYICLNVYLYTCACTNVFSCSVMDLRSVVSKSGSTVLRINGRSRQRQRKRRKRVIFKAPPVMYECGVKANYGLVPLKLGIGHWCGHMVDYDEVGYLLWKT